jgi:cytidine deaminase
MTKAPAKNEMRELVDAAERAAERAYAPYSRFRVGASVLGERGIYLGANVENASSGLSLCAERAALAAAVAAGDSRIRAVGIACIDAPADGPDASRMPCGACRQWLAELAPDAAIAVLGVERLFTARELLPDAFRLRAEPSA